MRLHHHITILPKAKAAVTRTSRISALRSFVIAAGLTVQLVAPTLTVLAVTTLPAVTILVATALPAMIAALVVSGISALTRRASRT